MSVSVPISVLENQIAGTALPGQDSTTGTNTTTQSSSVADVSAPVNACSLSVGADAGAGSGCSTTSVGSSGDSNLANANVPVTAQDNAVGLLNQEGSALGVASGQSSAATTQDGAVNADAPVSLCSIDAGVAGDTSSDCGLSGTSGDASQTGVVDVEAPVTVCDVIAEVDGTGSANCPQETNSGSQSGQLADADVPVTACGAVVAVDGSAAGSCQPASDATLTGDLPTSDQSQSAPVDGILPVSGCSVVVAAVGSATNSCEPDHVAPAQSGSSPINGTVNLCSVVGLAGWFQLGDVHGRADGQRDLGRPARRPDHRCHRAGRPLRRAGFGGRQRQRGLPRAFDECQHRTGERQLASRRGRGGD